LKDRGDIRDEGGRGGAERFFGSIANPAF